MRPIIAAAKFELMDEEAARKALAGRNERDPLVCAVLSFLHQAKADAAVESNDPKNPEWLANRCAGGLHWLMQFEAELKEALSAAPESAGEAERNNETGWAGFYPVHPNVGVSGGGSAPYTPQPCSQSESTQGGKQ